MSLDLMTFVVAMIVVLSVHIPLPVQTAEGLSQRGSVWFEAWSGLRYLWAHRPLLYVSLLNFLVAGSMILATSYILGRTDNNELVLGAILSLMNIGALVGGVTLASIRMHLIIPGIVFASISLALLGVSNFTVDQLKIYRAAETVRTRILTVQNRYNLLDGEGHPGVLAYAAEHQIDYVAWGPLARGLLTDRYLDLSKVGEGDRLYDEGILGHDAQPVDAALHAANTGYGTGHPVAQLEANAALVKLDPAQLQQIKSVLECQS
jgi:hypothetical protein